MTAIKPIIYPEAMNAKCIQCDDLFHPCVGGVLWVGMTKTHLICQDCLKIIPMMVDDMMKLTTYSSIDKTGWNRLVEAGAEASKRLDILAEMKTFK